MSWMENHNDRSISNRKKPQQHGRGLMIWGAITFESKIFVHLSCFLHVSKWRATEFRHFPLYVGPFALRNCCNEYMYKLFMQLSTSVRILSSKYLVKCASHVEYAKKLLISFVSTHSRGYRCYSI